MKFFKIFAFSIFILIVLVVGGLFIFIKTFDVNAYLPQITKAASQAMGEELTIQKASLDISSKGLFLKCQGIDISDPKHSTESIVKVKEAQVGVNFMPFLVSRKLDFNAIDIWDIHVHISDPKMPLDINIPQMHAQVHDFSLTEPYHIQLDFIFASQVENVHVKAQMQLDSSHGKIDVSNMILTSDLAQLNMADIRTFSPVLKAVVLPISVRGDLKVDVMQLVFGAKGLEALQAHAVLENAGATLKEIRQPITGVRVDADIDLTKINLREFHLHIGEGSINGQAEITNYMEIANVQSKGNIDGIKIEDLIDVNILPVVIKGRINAKGNLSAQSFDPMILMKTLKGQGDVNITDGTLEKLNIVKSVLGPTLDMIPGLAEGLDSLITGKINDQLGEVTIVDKAIAQFSVSDQIVTIADAQVQTKPFDLQANGTVNFDLKVDMLTSILLSKDISGQISEKVEQLGYLRDENSRIKIGGNLLGIIPNFYFKPNVDVKNVAKSAIIDEGSKQLEKVIEKNPEVGEILDSVFGKDPATQNPDAPVENSQDKAKKSINKLLNSILK